jgi:glycine/D-amino acid oxidase-like deaminating enzyme
MLRDVKFTHTWGGPLGWSRDWMPTMRYDAAESVAVAGGYTGTGVATANLAGRLLADLIQRRDSDLTRLPMASHKPRSWEREPLRYLGVRFVQRGFERLDRTAERTGVPPSGRSIVERITRH